MSPVCGDKGVSRQLGLAGRGGGGLCHQGFWSKIIKTKKKTKTTKLRTRKITYGKRSQLIIGMRKYQFKQILNR